MKRKHLLVFLYVLGGLCISYLVLGILGILPIDIRAIFNSSLWITIPLMLAMLASFILIFYDAPNSRFFCTLITVPCLITFLLFMFPWNSRGDIDNTEVPNGSQVKIDTIGNSLVSQQLDQTVITEPDSLDIAHQARMKKKSEERDSILRKLATEKSLLARDSASKVKKKSQDAEFCKSDRENDSLAIIFKLVEKQRERLRALLQAPCECPPPKNEERLMKALYSKEKKN